MYIINFCGFHFLSGRALEVHFVTDDSTGRGEFIKGLAKDLIDGAAGYIGSGDDEWRISISTFRGVIVHRLSDTQNSQAIAANIDNWRYGSDAGSEGANLQVS